MDTESVIEIIDLVKRFGDQVVLNGVNLNVYTGETMVVMGGSGSGKSTILRHMIGALYPAIPAAVPPRTINTRIACAISVS